MNEGIGTVSKPSDSLAILGAEQSGDVTVTLQNRGLVPAEWLHVGVVPAEGDIAVYALTGEGGDIAPRDSGTVNVRLITTARPDAARAVTIQYYVYGMKREITVR